jgi:hypothetical protein
MAIMRIAGTSWVALAVLVAACGGGETIPPDNGKDGGKTDSAVEEDGPPPGPVVTSLAINPAAPVVVCQMGGSATVQLDAVATYSDSTTAPVDVVWSSDHPELGSIDYQNGLYTATGSRAGVAVVTATLGAVTATASVTVKVEAEILTTGSGMPPDPASYFNGTVGSDASRTPLLLYPENETVYPVGVYSPDIQWSGGVQNDLFRIRVKDQLVTITAYVNVAAFQMGTPLWNILGSSNTGAPVTIELSATSQADLNHTVFHGVPHTLTLAQARLGGTVYYWDLDAGKILRIRPGGTPAAEEFFTPPPEGGGSNRCVACHTLSRDGRKMAFEYYGGGNYGGVADVETGSVLVAAGAYRANYSTFNADGTLLVTSASDGQLTLRSAGSGAPVPTGSGEANLGTLLGAYNSHPSWSPDGGLLAYACSNVTDWTIPGVGGWDVEFGPSGICTIAWSQTNQAFDGATKSVLVPNDGWSHFYPTFSADNRFVVYNRGETCPYGTRTLDKHLSLWLASVAGGGAPVKLQRAAHSDQDLYPNFSPFIEGGYHFVAFYSRRAYGWRTTYPRRQVWVAAIDRDPAAGVDPSHPAFWLPGQNAASDNCSAYWAPEPCHASGETCETDLDCCSGLQCQGPTGAKTCQPPPTPCVTQGNLCADNGDCCAGLTCEINSAGEKVCTVVIP